MNVLNHLQIKEGIESCLFCPLCGHPLEMALVSAQRLYKLERSLCTYNHAILLNNLTQSYHLIERWRRHFGILITGVTLLTLLNLASCQAHLPLYHPYDLSISTFKFVGALPNLSGFKSSSSVHSWPIMRLRTFS